MILIRKKAIDLYMFVVPGESEFSSVFIPRYFLNARSQIWECVNNTAILQKIENTMIKT